MTRRKFFAGLMTLAMMLSLAGPALALSQGEAKESWISAQKARVEADADYRQAVLDYNKDKTPENEQKTVDTVKTLMTAGLAEVEAWLKWKQLEAQEDSRVPEDIKANIDKDVEANLVKIENYRSEVEGVANRAQAFVVFLKLVGGYAGLLADVARNTGAMWGSIGDQLAVTVENFEAKLRTAVLERDNNADLLAKLDVAKSEVDTAKSKIQLAKTAYEKVVIPGTPLIKFAEGNKYLRQAQINLVNAQAQLEFVFSLLTANK
jgi:hypothetical protein